MAASLKGQNEYALSFQQRLEQLSCPYTEGVDASWIMELIFQPGEARIRLLQWLFSRFDSQLEQILDPQLASTDNRMESRIQRLLFVASSMGLCRPDDANLIRGSTFSKKQLNFMDMLLDMVCTKDLAEDTQFQLEQNPGKINCSLDEQFRHQTWFVDTLADHGDLANVFSSRVNLLPPDILKQVEQGWQDKGYKDAPSVAMIDSEHLVSHSQQLEKDLAKQREILEELIKQYDHPDLDPQAVAMVNRKMRLVLSELSQLVVGFSYGYQNEMQPWCNKEPPKLTNLGPAFKTVHALLQQFITMLSVIGKVRSKYNNLSSTIKDKVHCITEKEHKQPIGIVSADQGTLNNFQDCIDILEQSLLRHEASMAQDPNVTVNAAVVKLT